MVWDEEVHRKKVFKEFTNAEGMSRKKTNTGKNGTEETSRETRSLKNCCEYPWTPKHQTITQINIFRVICVEI